MKFEIVNLNENELEKQEKVIRLGLKQGTDGIVNLVVLDENDENGGIVSYLLEILLDGTFVLIEGVDPNIGFPLVDNDVITII